MKQRSVALEISRLHSLTPANGVLSLNVCFRQLKVASTINPRLPTDTCGRKTAVLYGPKTVTTRMSLAPTAMIVSLITTDEPLYPTDPATDTSEDGNLLFQPVEGSTYV